MREIHVVADADWPYQPGGEVAHAVAALDRLAEAGHDVVTNEDRTILSFLSADDTEMLLTDPRFSAGVAMAVLRLSGVHEGPLYELWSQLMFGKDGEDHRRLRQSVARRLTPRAVEAMRDQVEGFSAELLDGWAPGATVDVWPSYAVPLPARTACALVGIPDHDALQVAEWALALVRAFGFMSPEQFELADQAAVAFTSYLDELMDRRPPATDGVLAILAGDDAPPLSRDEGRALVANLVFGGLDAVAKSITTGLLNLLGHPDQWAVLCEDPAGRAPGAVAELLRFSPPAMGVPRLTTEPAVCRGVDVPAWQLVIASLRGSCRDARQVERPDELDVGRPVGKQYAFGAGPHYCIGASLARLTLEVAFTDLATRFPDVALADPGSDVPWTNDPFTGVVSLPVQVPASPG